MTIKITALRGLILAFVIGSLVACQKSDDGLTTRDDLMARGYASEEAISLLTNTARILGPQGEPVQGARILIGAAPGVPFAGNEIVADAQGAFVIPAEWTNAQPVTIEAPGYIRTSFSSVEPVAQDYLISFSDGDLNLQVKGKPIDYKNIRRDGKVDFGLVIRTFTRRDLISFDLSSVISTDNDSINILGFDLNIPSNLTLPRQQESYFFSIELNKPNYRLPVRRAGTYRYMAAQGQFPISQVFDEIRGGASIFDVANYLTFLRGGLKEVTVVDSSVSSDMSVNQFEFNSHIELKAPSYGAGKLVFGLAAVEQDGLLFPSDLKILSPNQRMRLRTPSQGTLFKAAVLLNKAPSKDYAIPDFNQLSLSLQDGDDTRAAQFLEMIPAPSVQNNVATVTPPPALAGVRPVATYLILSELETVVGGAVPLEKKTRMWELLTPGWVSSVDLPEFQFNKKPNRKYKWEVLFLGQDETLPASDSLDEVTHITRNSFIF